ncbi:anti-sigma regulatory factor (Ser/Thr protein kinase) [Nocardiopsis mwathae]|uniref:Anti-sigma regulatory factor (Ser/Thr protein kinase) n=1 Tax=Nocardiopsis mwathae TaxID=1472723 RepID=A0A7X0D6H8_9ACTN|nr:ATP-binding protein [Nocardiopsis mwathae]MBB6172129.1 anti-sigma regulatory factor (Ser/Thr protein kinase) [Nocardiopsis mwathae]
MGTANPTATDAFTNARTEAFTTGFELKRYRTEGSYRYELRNARTKQLHPFNHLSEVISFLQHPELPHRTDPRTYALDLPGEEQSAGQAREFVHRKARGIGTASRPIRQVTGELVANALRHSRSGQAEGCIALRLTLHPEKVRVEVTDDGPAAPGDVPQVQLFDPDRQSGRGLMLVEAFTLGRWGFHRRPDGGTTVWAEVPR